MLNGTQNIFILFLQINKDCTGTNYIRFKCRYFKDEYFDFELSVSRGIGTSGSYGECSDACSANSAISGVKTTIVAIQGEYFDDTALNDVQFFCCEYRTASILEHFAFELSKDGKFRMK